LLELCDVFGAYGIGSVCGIGGEEARREGVVVPQSIPVSIVYSIYLRFPVLCVHGTDLFLRYAVVTQDIGVVESAELRRFRRVLWRMLEAILGRAVTPVCAALGVERRAEVESVKPHVGIVAIAVERGIDSSR
jgi:hypothetical protein